MVGATANHIIQSTKNIDYSKISGVDVLICLIVFLLLIFAEIFLLKKNK